MSKHRLLPLDYAAHAELRASLNHAPQGGREGRERSSCRNRICAEQFAAQLSCPNRLPALGANAQVMRREPHPNAAGAQLRTFGCMDCGKRTQMTVPD